MLAAYYLNSLVLIMNETTNPSNNGNSNGTNGSLESCPYCTKYYTRKGISAHIQKCRELHTGITPHTDMRNGNSHGFNNVPSVV